MFAEQFSSAAKANLESQFEAATQFHSKAFEGVAQLVDLNLKAARATFEESAITVQQLLAAKDAREVLQLVAAQSQPAAAKAVAYSRNLAGIAATTQSELAKATEEQVSARAREVNSLVDQLLKNAPAGTEQFAALFKTALNNTNAGIEQLNKLSKQANESIEENLGKVFEQFAPGAEKAGRRK